MREGLPWEMLYADDLVLVGKCEEELKEKLRKWNECLKDKGLKINEGKTKVMCEHAILKRIQTGWLKFRELSGLLIGRGI